MNINIRQADQSDLKDILALYGQPTIDNGNTLPLETAQILYSRIRSYPDYNIYVALSDEQTVGTFALLIMDNLGHLGKPSGIVEDVAVDPDFQNKGVGKKMMDHALKICQQAGCYKIVLSSNMIREKAHRFYESLGYERHGYSFLIRPA